jgi:hypothetical protein
MLPHDPSESAELAAMRVRDLLVVYANWRSRFVDASPRNVHISAKLRANPLYVDAQFVPAVAQIQRDLRIGFDVRPYLSRLVLVGYDGVRRTKQKVANKQKLAELRDLDLLLNDWGVHHLHLSTIMEPDGFVERTGPLLMAAFTPQDAYLIDIAPHGSWGDVDLLRTMVREWPDAGLMHELRGVLGLSRTHTDAEYTMLRRAGIAAFFEIDGKFFTPRESLSTGGTTFKSVRRADDLLARVADFKERFSADPGFVARTMAEKGNIPVPSPDLHFEFFELGYGVVERQTGFRFRLAD